jgi:tRNA threonylcarbamoyladenosine biosynthesis protein TsaE
LVINAYNFFVETTIAINSLADLAQKVNLVFTALGNRKKIALYGEMGAGKTTFTKAFCQHLGVKETTASPTFSLINQYSYTDAKGEKKLIYHLDLYRLHNLQEAYDIGIEDVLYDNNYCLIEWPQLIEPILEEDVAIIHVKIAGKNKRTIQIL